LVASYVIEHADWLWTEWMGFDLGQRRDFLFVIMPCLAPQSILPPVQWVLEDYFWWISHWSMKLITNLFVEP